MQYFVNAIGIIVIIVGIIMIILLVVLLREKRSLNNHKQTQSGIENYYEKFDRIQRELTDLRGDIEVLKGKTEHFVERGSEEEKETTQSFNNPFYTTCIMLQEVIRQNIDKAVNRNIKMNIEGYMFDLSGFGEEDIVGLVDNLLRNAMESCERVDESCKREILFRMNRENSNLVIHMKNTKKEELSPLQNSFQTIKEEKKEHGFGMQLIYQIVDKYKGNMDVKDLGKQLVMDIRLEKMKGVEER